jgi:Undecaprenyl-phosphate glucose phosphotransferase
MANLLVPGVGRSTPGKSVESGFTNSAALNFRIPYFWVEPAVFAIDAIAIIASSVLGGIFYHLLFFGQIPDLGKYLAVGVLAFANFSAILFARGDYRVRNLISFRRQARDVVVIWTLVFLLWLGVAFSLKVGEDFSRGAVFAFFAFTIVGIPLWRKLLAQLLTQALSTGAFAERNIVLIGDRTKLARSNAALKMRQCGYTPVLTIELVEDEMTADGPHHALGRAIDSVIETAHRHDIDDIFLLVGWQHSFTIDCILRTLSVLPIPVHLLPDENVSKYLGGPTIELGTTWGVEVQRAPLTRLEQVVKRAFDLVGAFAVLLVLSPLMLATAIFIKLDSAGPMLFFQKRNGFSGRSFNIVKFRTMRVLENGQLIRQAQRDDPRVTRVGRILRRSNIDELPQLLNVLSGEMSLVGPRPHATAHDDEYAKLVGNYAFRNHVKPGITGWAQVSGYRGETATVDLMAKRVELDLWYINHWSVWLDIRILLRTMLQQLRPSGY